MKLLAGQACLNGFLDSSFQEVVLIQAMFSQPEDAQLMHIIIQGLGNIFISCSNVWVKLKCQNRTEGYTGMAMPENSQHVKEGQLLILVPWGLEALASKKCK